MAWSVSLPVQSPNSTSSFADSAPEQNPHISLIGMVSFQPDHNSHISTIKREAITLESKQLICS